MGASVPYRLGRMVLGDWVKLLQFVPWLAEIIGPQHALCAQRSDFSTLARLRVEEACQHRVPLPILTMSHQIPRFAHCANPRMSLSMRQRRQLEASQNRAECSRRDPKKGHQATVQLVATSQRCWCAASPMIRIPVLDVHLWFIQTELVFNFGSPMSDKQKAKTTTGTLMAPFEKGRPMAEMLL